MSILDICDELAALIEPDPTQRDDSRVQPAEYLLDTLYVWPAREVHIGVTTGTASSIDAEEHVELRVAWAADRAGEGDLDRSVTEEVVARADAIGPVLRAHPTGETYEQMALASVDYEALTGFDVRGFMATLIGWTLRVD